MSEDKTQAIEDGDIIEISKDLLYQTWIDQPMFFTSILYFSMIKDEEKDVERFRLFHVLEKISSALVNKAHEKEIVLQVVLRKFRYDLVLIQEFDEEGNKYLTVGFPEDFLMDEEPVIPEQQDKEVIGQKKSRVIKDHLFSFFRGLYLEDQETAVKLFHCSMKDFYKTSIETEYEPGKRFYYAQVRTSVLPDPDRSLHISDYREKYLQVTPNNITQKGMISEKRKQVPFYKLHTLLEAMLEEDRPSLEDLFGIYNPKLKFTINFPPGIKYPQKMIINRRELYSTVDMAGYLLRGMQKDKAADLLLNLDCNDSSSKAIIAAICKTLRVSKNPDVVADRLLGQSPPYNIDPIFRTPYREGIVLADRLGYQVNWLWPLKVWEQKTDEWDKEEKEILTLLPEPLDDPLTKQETRELLEKLDSDDIPF
jgi:hypothetical protein